MLHYRWRHITGATHLTQLPALYADTLGMMPAWRALKRRESVDLAPSHSPRETSSRRMKLQLRCSQAGGYRTQPLMVRVRLDVDLGVR